MRVSFAAFSDADPGMSSQEVYDVQMQLVKLGYTLTVNGSYDGATSRAVLDFRSKQGLPLIDRIDTNFVTTLAMQGRGGGIGTPNQKVAMGLGIGALVIFGIWWVSR